MRWVPVRVMADGGRGRVEPAEATAAVMGGAAAGLDVQVEGVVAEANAQ